VIHGAEVILLGTKSIDKETLEAELRPDQVVIDLVNLEKERRCRRREDTKNLLVTESTREDPLG